MFRKLRSTGGSVSRREVLLGILIGLMCVYFASEFLQDMSPAGRQVHFRAMRKKAAEHPCEKVGKEIRQLYSWSDEDKLINN